MHVQQTDEATGSIGEGGLPVSETNPLALVPDSNPIPSPHNLSEEDAHADVSVSRVRQEETELKIAAWQTAEAAKVNNRFKREEVVINGWEKEQIEKATSWLRKIEVCMYMQCISMYIIIMVNSIKMI